MRRYFLRLFTVEYMELVTLHMEIINKSGHIYKETTGVQLGANFPVISLTQKH